MTNFVLATAIGLMRRIMTRGGKREGAGRKPTKTPLKKITVAIKPELVDKLQTVSEIRRKPKAQIVSEWLKRLF